MKKGDYRRLIMVLAVLALKEQATASQIAELTGFPRSTVFDVLTKLLEGQFTGLILTKNKKYYHVIQWSDFLQKDKLSCYMENIIKGKKGS